MTSHLPSSIPGDKKSLPQSQKTRKVIQDIFSSDTPELALQAMPAQTLYLAIARQGLFSSSELIEIMPTEKVRLLLDFDCWNHDKFSEDAFWSWLELPDAEGTGLELLKKILQSVDLKLVALTISRHTNIWLSEEPTDNPPHPGFFTPDKGSTWIQITVEDEHKRFLIGRFLAYIFETDAELFYQLINIPQVATDSELEESAYQDKSKRLESEGFPTEEYAAELHAPLSERHITEALHSEEEQYVKASPDIHTVRPFTHDSILPPYLKTLTEQLDALEDFESELTLIMNAALVRYRVDLSNSESLNDLLSQVRGAINLGLEQCSKLRPDLDLPQCYRLAGLRQIYRYGLHPIIEVRNRAQKISDDQILDRSEQDDVLGSSALLSIISQIKQPFPILPSFLKPDGTLSEVDGKLLEGNRAIESMEDIETIRSILGVLEK